MAFAIVSTFIGQENLILSGFIAEFVYFSLFHSFTVQKHSIRIKSRFGYQGDEMAKEFAVRTTEERARALLKQSKILLIICVVSFAIFCVYCAKFKMDGIAMGVFAIYWFAGVGYFIWLGRLAHGLGRSVVYYVGGTWLLSSAIFLFAHIIAYSNVKSAVNSSFPSAVQAVASAG
jgi:hypothetical protein